MFKCYFIIKFVYVYQVTPSLTWMNWNLFFFFSRNCFYIKLLIIMFVKMFDIQYWKWNNTYHIWKIKKRKTKNLKSQCCRRPSAPLPPSRVPERSYSPPLNNTIPFTKIEISHPPSKYFSKTFNVPPLPSWRGDACHALDSVPEKKKICTWLCDWSCVLSPIVFLIMFSHKTFQ